MKRMTIILFFTLVLVMMALVPLPVSASTNGHKQAEAVAWANKQVGEKLDYDQQYGAQCVGLICYYLAYLGNKSTIGGNAIDYMSKTLPSGWSSPSKPSPGDIVVWGKGVLMTNGSNERSDSNYGHIGIVLSVSGDTMTTLEQNTLGVQKCVKRSRTVSKVGRVIHPDWPGKEMNSGYARSIPDGDYLICTAGTSDKSSYYFLDIKGAAVPAQKSTNVQIYGPLKTELPAYDIWTVKYSNGFYTITQKGTNMALDVVSASKENGANVQVYTSNNSSAQKWAISSNGRNGYRIQAKCSGFSLDVKGGKTTTPGTNVQQYSNNDTDAQSWFFVPYQPSQPIENGRYILLSNVDNSYELDVDGDTGDIKNHTNVQIWKDTASSQYNAFTFTKLSNGYYKITQSAGNKALDVNGAASTIGANISMYTDNGSSAQQWAVTRDGAGYVLRAKCSGMALDVYGGKKANGTNVQQYPYNGTKAQNWKIVPAEYTVSYNANSGSGAPAAQVKYYKKNLTLSASKPTRSGYTFMGWSTNQNATTASYQPGVAYSVDSNLVLYAVWALNSSSEPEPADERNVMTLQIGNPELTVNGQSVYIDEQGTTPMIINNRTMLPIRAIIENMGGTVDWDGDDRIVTLEKDGRTLYLQIGNSYCWDDDGETIWLDSPPVIRNNRTMLPVRAVAEYFDATVDWEDSTRVVTITY